MNYRHAFHAGNFADCAKHALLLALTSRLQQKEGAICFIGTHAGRGLYDLQSVEAQKTNEAEGGILKLRAGGAGQDALAPYLTTTKGQFYPGSPMLLAHKLRPQDHLVACEKHPQEFAELKKNLPRYTRIHLHMRDGYEALMALVPPEQKRGLVIIDPPFEKTDEFATMADVAANAAAKWPNATYMLWYPIKDRRAQFTATHTLMHNVAQGLLQVEFLVAPETESDVFRGAGHYIINPPYRFDVEAEAIVNAVHAALGSTQPKPTVKWLREPT